MTLEYVDVKWTVISKAALEDAVAAVLARLPILGWQLQSLETSDVDGVEIDGLSQWPEQVLGSIRFQKNNAGGEVHSLFWNAQRVAGGSKIVGGLYLRQYGHDLAEYPDACKRAFDDVQKLFDVSSVQCVALSLEDDDEVDVAPGVMGAYRRSVWDAVLAEISQATRGAFCVEQGGEWTIVCPIVDTVGPLRVRDMPEGLQASLAHVQAILSRQFRL